MGHRDLSLLRYKPDFVTSLFVINELYCIAINSFSIKHEHAHDVVVKNGGRITSHNKRGEQAFLY